MSSFIRETIHAKKSFCWLWLTYKSKAFSNTKECRYVGKSEKFACTIEPSALLRKNQSGPEKCLLSRGFGLDQSVPGKRFHCTTNHCPKGKYSEFFFVY